MNDTESVYRGGILALEVPVMRCAMLLRRVSFVCVPMWCVALVVVGVVLGGPVLAVGTRGDDEPAKSVFFSGTYDEARAAVKDSDRVLVLYFTATWCGPCKQMERTTWVDGRVVELLTTKGLVFKIDVDEQREVTQKYGVRAMPTMIAVKDGEVFDRVVGGRNPEQMVEWFEGVRRGERSIDAQRRRVEQRKPGEHDVQGRMELARSLMAMQSYGEAMEHLLWVWDHSLEHEPSFVGVRGSFMVMTIKELCEVHPPAKAAFGERRDAAERKMADGAMDVQLAMDFVGLNDALGDSDRSLAWLDANKDDARKKALLQAASSRLVPMLLEADRWADAGRVMSDVVEQAQVLLPTQVRMWEGVEGLDDKARGEMVGVLVTQYANEHAALLAAGRESEGVRMAALVTKQLGDRGRVGLVRAALRAKAVRPMHLRMLNAVKLDHPSDIVELRTKLEAALAEHWD